MLQDGKVARTSTVSCRPAVTVRIDSDSTHWIISIAKDGKEELVGVTSLHPVWDNFLSSGIVLVNREWWGKGSAGRHMDDRGSPLRLLQLILRLLSDILLPHASARWGKAEVKGTAMAMSWH